MSVGFVAESPNRKAVFSEVASGERDPARIAKKHRLVPRMVERALAELAGAGLVKEGKEGFALTDQGAKVLSELKLSERPPS